MNLLRKDEVQIGIIRGDYLWNDKKMLLSRESMCLISNEEIDMDNLPSIPRIDYQTDKSLKTLLNSWWHQQFNQPPYIAMNVDKIETCKEMVKHGLGYAIIPQICLKPSDKLYIQKITSDKSYDRETWLLYRDSLLKLSLIKAFVKFMKSTNELHD